MMNPIQALYCQMYQELEKEGRDGNKARLNGIILGSAMLVLNSMTLLFFFIGFSPRLTKFLGDLIISIFGDSSGKLIGQFIGLILFLGLFWLIKNTLGRETYFQKTIQRFKSFSDLQKKKIVQMAWIYMILSISMMLFSIFLL